MWCDNWHGEIVVCFLLVCCHIFRVMWNIIVHNSHSMCDGTPFSSLNGNQIESGNTSNVNCEFRFSCSKVILHVCFLFFKTLQQSLNNTFKFIVHVCWRNKEKSNKQKIKSYKSFS